MRTQMYDSNSTNLNSNSSVCFFLPFALPTPPWSSRSCPLLCHPQSQLLAHGVSPDAMSIIYDTTINNVVRLVTGYILNRQSGNMAGLSDVRAAQHTMTETHKTNTKTVHTTDDAASAAGGEEDEGRAASSSSVPLRTFVSSGDFVVGGGSMSL